MTSMDYDSAEPLTSTGRPLSYATITVRVIKSFPYRNVKNIIMKNYDLQKKSAKDLLNDCVQVIQNDGSYRPYRNVEYDCLKIYTHAHGSKTVNLVINFEKDKEQILDMQNEDKKLYQYGIENETEISLFKYNDYLEFKSKPEEKWL
ncbi:hypothetical protein HG535_0F05580 [Zygotorulaspora mrakii]|uniref:Altered inheritance rate of mitochondria protein 29 n=1 Tax=Zygotorulaspora mrakii TaxID=42260 RepID=A0A7H9B6T9_ZYGMR|nr:uncharacterized protein HG535_0F05580 [Zygotorulaspora mrakii]QLG74046.1 hypothetical protein HG535_0F05580 [Zygotorulaspora mrakii]